MEFNEYILNKRNFIVLDLSTIKIPSHRITELLLYVRKREINKIKFCSLYINMDIINFFMKNMKYINLRLFKLKLTYIYDDEFSFLTDFLFDIQLLKHSRMSIWKHKDSFNLKIKTSNIEDDTKIFSSLQIFFQNVEIIKIKMDNYNEIPNFNVILFLSEMKSVHNLKFKDVKIDHNLIVSLLDLYPVEKLTLINVVTDLGEILNKINKTKTIKKLTLGRLIIHDYSEFSEFIINYKLESLCLFEIIDNINYIGNLFPAIAKSSLKCLKIDQKPYNTIYTVKHPSIEDIEHLISHPTLKKIQLWNTESPMPYNTQSLNLINKTLVKLIKCNTCLNSLKYGLSSKIYSNMNIFDCMHLTIKALKYNHKIIDYNCKELLPSLMTDKINKYIHRNRIFNSEIFILLCCQKYCNNFPIVKNLIIHVISKYLSFPTKLHSSKKL